jgi:hypothetical protein
MAESFIQIIVHRRRNLFPALGIAGHLDFVHPTNERTTVVVAANGITAADWLGWLFRAIVLIEAKNSARQIQGY